MTTKDLVVYKIISFTDVHLADKNPISRKDDYKSTILNKLEQIKDICSYKKADLALCGGDLFHIKAPTKTSHHLVSQVIDLFNGFPCPVLSIYGNHDISQDNVSTLPKQPFYTLIKSGAIQHLTDYFNKDKTVRIFGVDYSSNPEYSDFNRETKGEKIQICVAHVNASSKFNNLFGERVYTYQDLQNTTPNIFIFGHYHPDQDIEVHNNKHFVNVGSISRGSLKKDDIVRIPAIGYVEISDDFKVTCEKIRLNALSACEVFDLELKNKEEKEQEEIENFINEMKSKITVNNEDNLENKIKSLNFEKSIIDKAMYYYEKVE